MSDQNTKRTIVEEGSELTGTLKSNCSVMVSGRVNGEIQAPSLTVTEGGAVHGTIKVNQLKSQGEVAGEIDAETIELSGRVNDQTVIRAGTLEVKLTAPESQKLQVVFGNCTIEAGKDQEAPKEQKPQAQPQQKQPQQQPQPQKQPGGKLE